MPGLCFDRHVAWCSGPLILACDLVDALGLVLFRNASSFGCPFVRVSFGARFLALCLELAWGALWFILLLFYTNGFCCCGLKAFVSLLAAGCGLTDTSVCVWFVGCWGL